MAGDDEGLNKATDGSSIRPVSSLRSHFEALKHAKPSSEIAQSLKDTQARLLHHTPGQRPTIAKASLDLPRPQSPWSTPETRHGERPVTPQHPRAPVPRTVSPRKTGHQRPMSMDFRSTPHLTPSVTIDSPRSPPKINPASRSGSRSPERLLSTVSPGTIREFSTQRHQPFSVVPLRPQSAGDNSDIRAQDSSRVPGANNAASFPPRVSSIPPAVNRAEKPKIASKPKQPQQHEATRLTPEPIDLSGRKVSPFNTPPSSEGSPSPERQIFRRRPSPPDIPISKLQGQANGPSSDTFTRHRGEQPRDARFLGFSGPTGSIEPRDARSLGLNQNAVLVATRDLESVPTRASTVSESSSQITTARRDARDLASSAQKSGPRHVSEQVKGLSAPQAPKIPSAGFNTLQREPRQFDVPKAGHPSSHADSVARRSPPRPPADSNMLSNTRDPPAPPLSFDRSTKPASSTRKASIPAAETRSDFLPPPRRTTFEGGTNQAQAALSSHATSTQSSRYASGHVSEDSDEAQGVEPELPMTRSEYPDASQANRRPPQFHQGAQQIPTKFDSRVFDICGQFICTTGYVTRAWDLSRGEQIFSLSHGETVKMVSVIFKPAERLEDEGGRLWIGSNIGELHEVDVVTQAIVGTSAVHNRREVVRILRHGKDLWTLDDEGKLCVWRAQDGRMPSLKYSHHAHRVPKGHTFSMVVQDTLWYATGREVRIYRPGNDSSFSFLPKPLSQPSTGDITSGAWTSRQGGRVYLGHVDGKVSIYSAEDYACTGVVKASDYKINAMSMVGENLWAAYKTGKIYVYDTSCSPWKVKKDWRAHDGPTASMLLDRSSIWTLNRLQVASFGHDNCIRLWDGMLEEDWLETAMQSSDITYCAFREIRATVVTWNVGACNPIEIDKNFVSDVIDVEDPPELLVFGFQEIVDLEDRAVTAKSILGFAKKKDKESARTDQHVSRVYREWRDYLGQCIRRCMNPRYSYREVHTSCLIGLFQCIFVREEEFESIRHISAAEVKCGMKGRYGNKGAIITRFLFDDSSLCFINCHLAAGQTQTSHRNNDIAAILEAESLPVERNADARTSFYVGGGDGTQILDHEICILNGDLNYRIDAIPRNSVINMVNRGELDKLLERDQIMVSRRRVSGFRLSPFQEAPIRFAPTYKYDVGSDKYDTSEKKRAPAWCDRLLYRGLGRIKQVEYRRHEIRVSDHRPVSGTFKIRVKTIDRVKQEQARARCHQQFGEVQRRLAAEASIEYLVSSLGLTDREARTALSDSR